jgi:putative flippase GtrA
MVVAVIFSFFGHKNFSFRQKMSGGVSSDQSGETSD